MLELDSDFFWRNECVGAGVSGWGPRGAHESGSAPCEGRRALDPCGQVLAPLAVFFVPHVLKYSRKNLI